MRNPAVGMVYYIYMVYTLIISLYPTGAGFRNHPQYVNVATALEMPKNGRKLGGTHSLQTVLFFFRNLFGDSYNGYQVIVVTIVEI